VPSIKEFCFFERLMDNEKAERTTARKLISIIRKLRDISKAEERTQEYLAELAKMIY
jgi:hypothetical protein